MKAKISIKGHKTVIVKVGKVPEGYNKTPEGGYNILCKCGWDGGNFSRTEPAKAAYRAHIDGIAEGPFTCKRCKITKPRHLMRPDYRYICLACLSQTGNEWLKRNPSRSYEFKRRHHLMVKFGITLEEYESLLKGQHGVCGICQCELTDPRGFAPHLDHDHETGRVRGILCQGCNNGLGNFKDSISTLQKAINYLSKSPVEAQVRNQLIPV